VPYEFILLEIIGGMVAVQTTKEMSQRSQIVTTMIIITLVQEIMHLAYELLSDSYFTWSTLERYPFYFILIGGILLLFAYPLFWIVEKFFGFTSEMTLMELSNTNHPLLKKLTEEAPGTFQHSMQVATLASEIASKLGANVQLVRTGALYHDIGKLSRPVFFTENQSDKNPHDRITPIQSARAIIEHVTSGIKLAEHYNLPEVIKRFIITHHGQGKVKYFYITYKNEHPDEEIDESLFTYPGPNPESKEEAILMMSDSVEAASRSMTEYTEESISTLVDKIVDTQTAEGFFNNCDITLKDLTIAKSALKERLKTVYHTRISYPELLNEN
jgi:putative nucleotidyltransferase with HDIG domain